MRFLSQDPQDNKTEKVPWFCAQHLMSLAAVDGVPKDAFKTRGANALEYQEHSRREKPNQTVFVDSALAARFLGRHTDALAEFLIAVATQLKRPESASAHPVTLARQVAEQKATFDEFVPTLVGQLDRPQRQAVLNAIDDAKLGSTSGYIAKGAAAQRLARDSVWEAIVRGFCHRNDAPAVLEYSESQSTDASDLSQPVNSQERQQLQAEAVAAFENRISADLVAGLADLVQQTPPLFNLLMKRLHELYKTALPRLFFAVVAPSLQVDLDAAASNVRLATQCGDTKWNKILRPPYDPIKTLLGLDILPPAFRLESDLWKLQRGLRFLTTANWTDALVPQMPPHVRNNPDLKVATETTPVRARLVGLCCSFA